LYDDAGTLQHVGLASGFSEARRHELLDVLRPHVTRLAGHPWERGFLLAGSPMGRLPGAAARWSPDEMTHDWVPVAPGSSARWRTTTSTRCASATRRASAAGDPPALPSHAGSSSWSLRDDDPRRRPRAPSHEPRQGALARRRLHEAAARGVLRGDRTRAAAASRRQAADGAALSRRRRRRELAPERVPRRAGLVPGLRDARTRRPRASLLSRRRRGGSRVACEPGGDRAPSVHVARRGSARADTARVRPRSWLARRTGCDCGGRALAARPAVGARPRRLREGIRSRAPAGRG